MLSNAIEHVVIAVTEHEDMLRHIQKNCLIITPRSQVNSILRVIALAKNKIHSFGSGDGGLTS